MKPTWLNTMKPHTHIGHVDIWTNIVKKAGYPFYSWNDWVYSTEDGSLVSDNRAVDYNTAEELAIFPSA